MYLGHWIIGLFWALSKTTLAFEEADVKLTGGTCTAEGQVEIYHNGTWGKICKSGLGQTEADVICKALSDTYTGGTFMNGSQLGVGPIWLSGLVCSEFDDSPAECLEGLPPVWGVDECEVGTVAWIHCLASPGNSDSSCTIPDPEEDGELRIDGDCNWQGRLLISKDNVWETLCATNFDDIDAAVACRQLKFNTGWSHDPPLGQTDSEREKLKVDIGCHGNETRLDQCPIKTKASCPAGQTAGILCSAGHDRKTCDNQIITNQEGDLRLSRGKTSTEGQLQVFYHGYWGDVCDKEDATDVKAVCQRLGYSNGRSITADAEPIPTNRLLHYQGCEKKANGVTHCNITVASRLLSCIYVWMSCSNGSINPSHHPKYRCTPNPCLNGGQCSVAREGEIHCHCTQGFSGNICDKVHKGGCISSPCLNNGTCVDYHDQFVCRCQPSFTGHICQIKTAAMGQTHHSMTIVAITLGVLLFILLAVVIALTFWVVRGKSAKRPFRGMERLDEEMSVISDHQDDFADDY